jgi:IS5 family transposase
MLRIHCVQLFYNLSDPAMEDMLYEIDSVRRFVGLKITGPIPDESTILKFRHLLETHDLGMKLFEGINQHLAEQGLMLKEGTIVDAASYRRRHRPGTRVASAIRRCTRSRRVMSGTLG